MYKSTHRDLNITNQAPALQSARESLPGQRPRAHGDNFRIFQDFAINNKKKVNNLIVSVQWKITCTLKVWECKCFELVINYVATSEFVHFLFYTGLLQKIFSADFFENLIPFLLNVINGITLLIWFDIIVTRWLMFYILPRLIFNCSVIYYVTNVNINQWCQEWGFKC